MANRISEKEDVQKLGVGNVVYNNGGFPNGGMDYEKSRRFSYLFRGMYDDIASALFDQSSHLV